MRMKTYPLAFLGLVLLAANGPAWAAGRALELDDLFRLHRVSDPQVSPDGRSVAFVVSDPFLAENRIDSDVWVVAASGGGARKLTNSSRSDLHPRWSPDGAWIAFESNRDGMFQIWIVSATGGEARKLTSLSTGAVRPVWSADGRALAFVSAVYPEFSDGPFGEADRLNAERDAARATNPVKARVIDHLLYRHWNEWVGGKRQHIFVMPVRDGAAAGQPRDVTPGDNDAVPTSDTFTAGDEFAFSPDGRSLVFAAPPVPVSTQAWSTNHDLYLVDLVTGNRRQLTTNPAADCTPEFSPDGRYLAYRAQSRPGFEADRWQLLLLDLAGGRSRSLTAGLDRPVGRYAWSADGSRIFFHTHDNAGETLWSVGVKGGAAAGEPVRVLVGGTNGAVSVSADGQTIAYTHERFNLPPEVMLWRYGEGAPLQLTHMNDALLAGIELPEAESVTVAAPTAAGAPVQMWILRPPHFDAAKKYPLIFWVHGGPQGAWNDGWSTRWNAEIWAAQGYVLAMPNPHGSEGFGQKFTDEISHDWSGQVMADLFACLDHMEKLPYVDSSRMAAAGASYGGYAMNWLQGHTNRFRTIVCHDGIYNLESMYGETDEVWFSDWEQGRPWEMTAADRAASPHLYAANFKTPMLIIHGELDFRIPETEALQLFTALQRQGVPSRLLLFPDEGHWVLKPANSELWHRTVFNWLAEYLKK